MTPAPRTFLTVADTQRNDDHVRVIAIRACSVESVLPWRKVVDAEPTVGPCFASGQNRFVSFREEPAAMTAEILTLALAILLQAVQFVLFAVGANRDLGPGYTMSARDRPPSRTMSERTARLQRALNNHFEGLILFTAAVVVVTSAGQSTAFTAACGWAYLLARLLYVPAYAFGWRPWRSVVWGVGFAATLAMVVAALI